MNFDNIVDNFNKHYQNTNNFSTSCQGLISKLANCFNKYRIMHFLNNNASNGVAMPDVIYFTATAVAPSVFRPTQNKLHIILPTR